mmetsp:Transcript_4768/g.8180  ORF Transcript_4768/g.8180 Transcript_4768/m.8180 type:complete len:432 (-) Transcript_4768:45-1340(-)
MGKLTSQALLLLLSLRASYAQIIAVRVPDVHVDQVAPMGLTEVSSVFPFAGPFAPTADGTHGDRFLHESLHGIDVTFLRQLLPVMQSRWHSDRHPCEREATKHCEHADSPILCLGSRSEVSRECLEEIQHTVPYRCNKEIHSLCNDNLEVGILPCLEGKGQVLGHKCMEAIVAARHALSSLHATHSGAMASMSGAAPKPLWQHGDCPAGWEGPLMGGCCTRRWSSGCGAECSANQCVAAHTAMHERWEFIWADFRTKPYICCPVPTVEHSAKYVGGQALCPDGWNIEQGSKGHCCRRAWSWDCGEPCAWSHCSHIAGFRWVQVDTHKEQFKCCADHSTPLDIEGHVTQSPSSDKLAHHPGAAVTTPHSGPSGTAGNGHIESKGNSGAPLQPGLAETSGPSAGFVVMVVLVLLLVWMALKRVLAVGKQLKDV